MTYQFSLQIIFINNNMETQLTFTLLASGILAGAVNFFVTYLGLPFQSQTSSLINDEWPRPQKLWIAILGYIIVGIAGALLTPLINALIGLKGYFPNKDFIVAFGYGLIFGYSATKLLVTLLSSVLKKVSNIETKVNQVTKMSVNKSINENNSDFSLVTSDLKLGEHYPNNLSEVQACGNFTAKIIRDSSEFKKLKKNINTDIIFKDEERTGADQMMNDKLFSALNTLAAKVKTEWKIGSNPKYKLRVTEAWDENNEHAGNSLHYEARAADINLLDIVTNTVNTTNLGKLSALAIDSGFDWVWYEDDSHVHVSCKR
jgi:hypothetical protein